MVTRESECTVQHDNKIYEYGVKNTEIDGSLYKPKASGDSAPDV